MRFWTLSDLPEDNWVKKIDEVRIIDCDSGPYEGLRYIKMTAINIDGAVSRLTWDSMTSQSMIDLKDEEDDCSEAYMDNESLANLNETEYRDDPVEWNPDLYL